MILHRARIWLPLLVAMLFSGCGGLPKELDPDRIAATHGMRRQIVLGARFHHLAYTQGNLGAASEIHVYLEGDGIPWRTRYQVSADPTPRNPLALRLMARDPAAALYVGRPCYFGQAAAEGCSPWLWTHGRYGGDVVDSLTRAIQRLVPAEKGREITLIGYSGGGALAALIAPRLGSTARLITVAANLDIDAWADRHGYSRLSGSLNPADQAPLPPRIRQLHLQGALDAEVPPESVSRFAAANRGAIVRVVPGYDHRCCWVQDWSALLGEAGP